MNFCPLELIAATWRNKKTRILAPLLALVLSPVILFLIAGVAVVFAAVSVFAACDGLYWTLRRIADRRADGGLTWTAITWAEVRAMFADIAFIAESFAARISAGMAALSDRMRALFDRLAGGCRSGCERVQGRWRWWLVWGIACVLAGLFGAPLVLLENICAWIRKRVTGPLQVWASK